MPNVEVRGFGAKFAPVQKARNTRCIAKPTIQFLCLYHRQGRICRLHSLRIFLRNDSGGKSAISQDHPGKPLGECRHQTQSNQTAPVLKKYADVIEIQLSQPIAHPSYVPSVGVILGLSGLVRAAKANQIWCNDTKPRRHQYWNHMAVHVAPYGLTVH